MGDQRYTAVLSRLHKIHLTLLTTAALTFVLSTPYIFPTSFLGCGTQMMDDSFTAGTQRLVWFSLITASHVLVNTALLWTGRLNPRWLWVSSLLAMLYWGLAALGIGLVALLFAWLMVSGQWAGLGFCVGSAGKWGCVYCGKVLPLLWPVGLWVTAIAYGMLWRLGRRVRKAVKDERAGVIGTQPGAIRLEG